MYYVCYIILTLHTAFSSILKYVYEAYCKPMGDWILLRICETTSEARNSPKEAPLRKIYLHKPSNNDIPIKYYLASNTLSGCFLICRIIRVIYRL